MPLDIDLLLRSLQEVVKQELAQLPKAKDYDDSTIIEYIEELQNKNASLEAMLATAVDSIQRRDEYAAKQDKRIAALENTHAEFVTKVELERVVNDRATPDQVREIATDVTETIWDEDHKNVVAAMLPDEIDVEAVVASMVKDDGYIDQVANKSLEKAAHRIEELVEPIGERAEAAACITVENLMPGVADKVINSNVLDNQIEQYVSDKVDIDVVVDKAVERVNKSIDRDALRGDVGPGPTQGQVDAAIEKQVETLRPRIMETALDILPKHVGLYARGTEYAEGQEVLKNNATFRAKRNTAEAPPHEDWQLIAKGPRGSKGDGEKGDKGDIGSDGVGVEDIVFEDGVLAIALSNGEAHSFDIGDQIEAAIIKHLNPSEE